MTDRWQRNVFKQFFVGTTESVFQAQLGVANPSLTDYLADLLVRFMRADYIFRMRSVNGKRLDRVIDMLREAQGRIGEARRRALCHVGDFSLFWSGVYPEALREMRSDDGVDFFTNYIQSGKYAYQTAASLREGDSSEPSGDILVCLVDHFELCTYGLREVRRVWEQPAGDASGELPLLI